MKSSAAFICLEFVFGLTLSLLTILYCTWGNNLDLFGGVLVTFLKVFIAIFSGVSLIGFIHVKTNKVSHGYGKSLVFCFAGLVLSSILYYPVATSLPTFFTLIIPLIGAVLGFNFKLTESNAA